MCLICLHRSNHLTATLRRVKFTSDLKLSSLELCKNSKDLICLHRSNHLTATLRRVKFTSDLKLSSLELCKNSKEEVGPDRSVSSNKFSSVTLNKLAMNR